MVLAATLLLVSAAQAVVVSVSATGQVVYNGIGEPPLGDVTPGEQVVMSFTVDSDNYVDGIPGDTRGYEIDQASFSLVFSGGLEIGFMDPFPSGQTPYFTLVEGFPVSDGFFVATSPVSPGGVPLEQDPINFNFDLGYEGDTLETLDILDAIGVYGYEGLTRFSFNFWQGFPDNVVMECDFEVLVIEEEGVPVTASTWGAVKAMYR
jgi:hypothetical protein